MAFLPDTNIWISLLKNPGGYSKPRFSRNLSRRFFLCSVAKAKLRHGAEEYGNRERRQRALEMLFAPFTSLPFDDAAARRYAAIRHHLEVQGRVMGPNDLKFAAIALSQGLTLVSADQQFSRVPGLSLLDFRLNRLNHTRRRARISRLLQCPCRGVGCSVAQPILLPPPLFEMPPENHFAKNYRARQAVQLAKFRLVAI